MICIMCNFCILKTGRKNVLYTTIPALVPYVKDYFVMLTAWVDDGNAIDLWNAEYCTSYPTFP